MPRLRKVVAVLVSDIHLSLRPPLFRSVEDDWLKAQAGYLDQLRDLTLNEPEDRLPVLCAGDVFDRWNSPPELINFAIKNLPEMYAVSGQHDQPNHSLKDIRRSAYWTLVEAEVIDNVVAQAFTHIGSDIRVWGYPWGCEITRPDRPHDMMLEVALWHSYCYTKGTGYPTAPKEKRIKHLHDRFKGYDVVLLGDNHTTFSYNLDRQRPGPAIFNPGSFMRRTCDQIDHRPCVGLLYSDGTVGVHYLDVSKDKVLLQSELDRIKVGDGNLPKFLGELFKLSDVHVDFEVEISRRLDQSKCSAKVRRIVLSAIEEARRNK